MNDIKHHWEGVYNTKTDQEVSWYQETPVASLNLINELKLNKNYNIIDIGGGNSNLTGYLLKSGYTNLAILDISSKALERTKAKHGQRISTIHYITSNVLDFEPYLKYDLWHDRATFHFLTKGEEIKKYVNLVNHAVKHGGYMIIATFSESGPKRCSGLDITQYSAEKLKDVFKDGFKLIKSFEDTHQTPFNTTQDFIYTLFQKK